MRLATIAIAMTLAGCGTYDGGGSVFNIFPGLKAEDFH